MRMVQGEKKTMRTQIGIYDWRILELEDARSLEIFMIPIRLVYKCIYQLSAPFKILAVSEGMKG